MRTRVLSLSPLPLTLEAPEWWWAFFSAAPIYILCGPFRFKADHALLVKRQRLSPPLFFTVKMNMVNLFQGKGRNKLHFCFAD